MSLSRYQGYGSHKKLHIIIQFSILYLSDGPEGSLVPRMLEKIVTWLILPVVICLSQRLSHACLSINDFVL